MNQGLPISTYLPEAPYQIGASLPTAFFNLTSPGLDQPAVRKAIAIAVDYPTIIANAMTNQSATFDQAPRSLMNPTAGEQSIYDATAVADLQWAGNDIEGPRRSSMKPVLLILMAMAGANTTVRSSAMLRPAPMVGLTGKPRSK